MSFISLVLIKSDRLISINNYNFSIVITALHALKYINFNLLEF